MRAAIRQALDSIALRQPHRVTEVVVPAHAPEWVRWLNEIDFLPSGAKPAAGACRW
jgi:hypothetical protein